jgi:hypothetical protein
MRTVLLRGLRLSQFRPDEFLSAGGCQAALNTDPQRFALAEFSHLITHVAGHFDG